MVVTSLSLGRAASFAGDLDKAKIAAARLFKLFATVPKIDPTSDNGEEPVCECLCVCMRQSVSLSVCQSVGLSDCVYVCMYVSVCLPVCVCVRVW